MSETTRLTELSDCYRRSGSEVKEMVELFEAEIKRLNGIIEDMPLIQRCRTCDDADCGTIYCRKCYYKLEAVKDDAFDVMKTDLEFQRDLWRDTAEHMKEHSRYSSPSRAKQGYDLMQAAAEAAKEK